MDMDDDDLDTQLLVTQVQLEDLALAQAQQKGKARADAPVSDAHVAIHHQRVVLEEQQILLRDRRLAQSVHRAVDTDREMLILMASVDRAERDDRAAAEALSRDEPLPAETDYQKSLSAYIYQLGQDNEFARRRAYAPDAASTASSSTLVSSTTSTAARFTSSTTFRPSSSTFKAPSAVSTIKPSDSASMARSSASSSSAPSLLSLLGAPSLLGSKAAALSSTPKSTNTSGSTTAGASTQRAECVVCTERRRMTMMCRAPCGHMYCNGCIVDLVGACTNDETLFPIRCCQRNIPEGDFVPRLPNELQDAYRARAREYSVAAKRRLYCANPRCSHFLGAAPDVRQDRVCERCKRATCTRCRAAVHPGSMCGEPEALRALDALATGNGWRRCGGCNAIVELTQGCFHITCRCRHQFCYLCGRTWKTCLCAQWDENRLVEDANRRVNNAHGPQAAEADPERHAERLEEAIDELQEDHICTGHTWAYRHGEGTCEECGTKESVFLMRCTNCQTLACRRCTQNRL